MATEIKIERIELYRLCIPLKEPFVISLGTIYSAENVVVVIHTGQGITGFGECSPFMSINGESAGTGLVVGSYLAKALIGKNPLLISGHVAEMDKIIYGNSSIKSAFDMALYDIAAQQAGLPLYKFLGGKNNKTIATDYTVSLNAAQKMAEDAAKYKRQGFPVIKVKLGDSKVNDT